MARRSREQRVETKRRRAQTELARRADEQSAAEWAAAHPPIIAAETLARMKAYGQVGMKNPPRLLG